MKNVETKKKKSIILLYFDVSGLRHSMHRSTILSVDWCFALVIKQKDAETLSQHFIVVLACFGALKLTHAVLTKSLTHFNGDKESLPRKV